VGAHNEDRHPVQLPEHGWRLPSPPRRRGSFEAAHGRRLIAARGDRERESGGAVEMHASR
jgi:hypothetical protein